MQVWEQQEQESAKAYEAFCWYRDEGVTRSARKIAQKHSKSIATIFDWSERFDWVARARAYDSHLELTARQQRESEHTQEIAAYRARAAKAAQDCASIGTAALLKVGKRIQSLDPEKIEPGMIPGYLRAAADLLDKSLNAEAEAIGVRRLESLLDDADKDAQ